ncbi:aspartate/glutamate racemase family protein [Anoxynatronum sibiricum]|uniref:Amino acid racemase n=1 Tax=Anoxynatronum sibiricum TaxID=210623 RepID=A0ABU9VPB2_9CLOT
MQSNKEKIIGILGGMGPEATWDLFGRITRATPAEKDSQHLHVIVDSNPKIPDRTKAILGEGPSPVDAMIATGKNLERAGADLILIPCMTAHYFIEQVQLSLTIPVVNGFHLMQRYLENQGIAYSKVAVIATTGSLQSKIYPHYLGADRLICPDENVQQHEVMDLIYGPSGIKAGYVSGPVITRLNRLIARFETLGADAVIAGCTEIGLVLKGHPMPLPVIDPLDLMAQEAVQLALSSV